LNRNAISTIAKAATAIAIAAVGALAAAQQTGIQNPFPVRWLDTPIEAVEAIAYSPLGGTLAIGGNGGVQVMSTSFTNVRSLATLVGDAQMVQFSPDGKTLAVSGRAYDGGRIELWNVSSGRLIVTLPERANNTPAFAFSPDGKTIAVAGDNTKVGWVNLHDATDFHVIRTYPTYATQIQSAAFSSDGISIALGGVRQGKGVLEFWEAASGKLTRRTTFAGGYSVRSMAFAADGKHFADIFIGQTGISLELRNGSGALIKRLPTLADYGLYTLAFSPDGKQLLSCGQKNAEPNGLLELWDVTKGALVKDLPTNATSGVFAVAWSPDGKKLASGGFCGDQFYTGNYAPLEIWNAATDTLQATYAASNTVGDSAVAYSPDNRTVASGASVTTGGPPAIVIQLRDAAKGTLRANLQTTATGGVNSLAFSKDSTLLACGGMNNNPAGSLPVLELWVASSGRPFAALSSGLGIIRTVAFSPEGKSLAVCGADPSSNPAIEVWDLSTLTAKTFLIGFGGVAQSMVWTLDSQSVVVAGTEYENNSSTGFIGVFSTQDGHLIRSFNFGDSSGIDTLAMSPDGKNVAAGGYKFVFEVGYLGRVIILNLASGQPVTQLPNVRYPTPQMAFLPRGDILLAGVSMYRTSDGAQVFEGEGPIGSGGPALSSDGLFIAYAGVSVVENPLANYGLLSAVSLKSSSIKAGKSTVATITLASSAPAGGARVTLSCDNSFLSLPVSVLVSAGKTSATFTVKVSGNATTSSGTITASCAFKSVSSALTIP